jgi:hypothetical protein
MMKQKTELLQGTLDLIVLNLLRAGPANGWDLTQSIQVVSKGALNVNYGSLYPALRRLEASSAAQDPPAREPVSPSVDFTSGSSHPLRRRALRPALPCRQFNCEQPPYREKCKEVRASPTATRNGPPLLRLGTAFVRGCPPRCREGAFPPLLGAVAAISVKWLGALS